MERKQGDLKQGDPKQGDPKKTDDGLVLAALAALGLLLLPGEEAAGKRAAGERREPASLQYHVLRFWGLNPPAPKEVIAREIDLAADREGIPRKLFRALVHVESRGDPKAVSHKGAIGLGQVLPQHVKFCGLAHVERLFDPSDNLRCSAKILRENLDRFPSTMAALATYNCGRPNCKAGLQYASTVLAVAGKG